MSLSIIYLNYFSTDQIKRSISSIIYQLGQDDTILIGDNSNNTFEFNKLRKLRKSNVLVFNNEGNHGFSKGCNLIINKIPKKNTWVLIINPDTIVHESFIKEFKRTIKNLDNNYSAISPLGYWMGTKKIWAAGGKFYWFRGRADVLNKEMTSTDTEFGTCACLFIKLNILKELGGLDEDYFLGGEEWQLSHEIRKNGGKILFNPKIKYEHSVSGTHEKYGSKFFYIGIRTKLIFVGKNYNILRKFVFWLMFLPYTIYNTFIYSNRYNLKYYYLIKISLKAILNKSKKLTESELIKL